MTKFILAAAFLFTGAVMAAPNHPGHPGHGHPGHGHGHGHHHLITYHCTAYAQGHGHDPRFSASASSSGYVAFLVEQRARAAAMNRCERRTGHHCHDIHCHQH